MTILINHYITKRYEVQLPKVQIKDIFLKKLGNC